MNIKSDFPQAKGLFERIIQFCIQNAIWVMYGCVHGLRLVFIAIKNYR